MRTRLLWLSLCLLFISSVALARDPELFRPATPEELAMKDVPFAPGASAVVLDWVRMRDDERSTESEYVRIKLLKDDAKKYADVELPYIPGFTRIRGIKARTITPDGTIRNFEGKIYDKLVVKTYGTRVMNKTFTLPEAGPGSILEYTYIMDWTYGLLFNTTWQVQRELPVLHQKAVLKPWLQGFACYYAYKGLPEANKPVKTREGYVVELQNMEPLPDEPFAPPSEFYAAKVLFYYQQEAQEASVYWKEYPEKASKAVEGFAKESDVVRTTAAQATAGAADEEAKLRAIYAKVQSLRNLSWEKDKSEQEEKREKLRDNRHVTDVLRNGYGTRTELNRVFLAMARAAGFDAVPMDVSQRDELFSQGIPDSSMLEEIVTVTVGGKPRFFDPGTAFLPFGMLAWDNAGSLGVRYPKKAEAAWIETPIIDAKDARRERIADLKLDGDLLTGTVKVIEHGHEALSRRWALLHNDEAEAKKSIEEDVKSWFPEGSTVKLTKVTAAKDVDQPFITEFDVTIAGLGSAAGSRVLLPMSVFTSQRKNIFSAQKRTMAIFFKHAYEINDRVTVTLPEDHNVDTLPVSQNYNYGALRFTNEWKKNGKAVTLLRTQTVEAAYIPLDRYTSARNFFSKVLTADQDAVVLKVAQ